MLIHPSAAVLSRPSQLLTTLRVGADCGLWVSGIGPVAAWYGGVGGRYVSAVGYTADSYLRLPLMASGSGRKLRKVAMTIPSPLCW